MNNNNFIEKISLNLKNTDIKDCSTLVLALSGGVDSTALILALGNIKSKYNLEIISAHFNHSLREKESDRDEKEWDQTSKCYFKNLIELLVYNIE